MKNSTTDISSKIKEIECSDSPWITGRPSVYNEMKQYIKKEIPENIS